MPFFQDPSDPIVDNDGVILYDRFGFDHIPQTQRFVFNHPLYNISPAGFEIGRVFTLIEELISPRYLWRNRTCYFSGETSASPTLSISQDYQPWSSSTSNHVFYCLTNVQVGMLANNSPVAVLTFFNSRIGDSFDMTETAARAAMVRVPKTVVTSKMQDLRTKVNEDTIVTRRTRALDYRYGYLFSFRSLAPTVRNALTGRFNGYLLHSQSPFAIPEERPARELPSSSPERTIVPEPDPLSAEPASTPTPTDDDDDDEPAATPPPPPPSSAERRPRVRHFNWNNAAPSVARPQSGVSATALPQSASGILTGTISGSSSATELYQAAQRSAAFASSGVPIHTLFGSQP